MPDSGWSYDAERYARITALRRAEQRAMAAFGADGRCLMRVLQEELDEGSVGDGSAGDGSGGPDLPDCGRCAVCTESHFAAPPDPGLVELAGRHLRSRPIELEVKKMAPDADGRMRKIADRARTEPGVALARFGDGGWWPAVERGLRGEEFDDEVVAALADALRAGASPPAWVTWVPSVRLGDRNQQLAQRVAAALGVPAMALVARVQARPPQSEMANAVQQAANVRGAFTVTGTPPAGTGALLDDRRGSGWTLAMVGGQLRLAGAERVVPMALATAF